MKYQQIVLFTLCCMLTACDRTGGVSSASALLQAQKDYDEQVKRQQAQLDAYDQQNKRGEALLVTQEQLMKRQLDAFARFEKILDTWESQQKQYQKYLDSLAK
jgi:hypothetical protein